MIVSDSVQRYIRNDIPCRLLSRAAVKGRTQGIGIYTPRRTLSELETEAWDIHHKALDLYFKQDFDNALKQFLEVQRLLPQDTCSKMYIDYCRMYMKSPPPSNWTGLMKMETK